jgi:tetratricopeptide (TPR) repeat protein
LTWAARSIELLEHRNQRHEGAEVGELAAALMVLADFHSQLAAHAAAEPLLRRAIAIFPPSTDERGTVTTLAAVRLGNTQRLRGSYQDAETTLRAALDNAYSNPVDDLELRAAAHNALGIVLKDTAHYQEAEEQYAAALCRCPDTVLGLRADILHNQAGLVYAQGRFDDAEALARQALEMREQTDGWGSTAAAADAAVLGAVLAALGRGDEAESLFHRCLVTWSTRYGTDHYEVAVALHNLGMLHHRRGDLSRAMHLMRAALNIKRRDLGPAHPEVAAVINNLGVLHAQRGQVGEARQCYGEALALLTQTLGHAHPTTAQCRHNASQLAAGITPGTDLAPSTHLTP